MHAGSPIRAYETMRGWWATTVRALSLVLVLAMILPGTVHSAEAHRSASHELALSSPDGTAAFEASHACPACHANCGCHQALSVDETSVLPSRATGRASYATVASSLASVSPDRLPRPPRA